MSGLNVLKRFFNFLSILVGTESNFLTNLYGFS